MLVLNVYHQDGRFLGRLKPSNTILDGLLKTLFMDEKPYHRGMTDEYNAILVNGIRFGELDINFIERHEPWKVIIKQEFDAEAEDYEFPELEKQRRV